MHRIVIIGGGFCGTLLSVHLLHRVGDFRASGGKPLHVTLIEREPSRLARGFAYATPHAACLLNVPAGRMSAFDDQVDHFIDWARARNPSIGGGAFVPRGLYGDYLVWLLREARNAASSGGVNFEHVIGHAVAIDDSPASQGARVALGDGRQLKADRIVLALGNFPPCDPACAAADVISGDRYTSNPWAPEALTKVSRDGEVLLIGTGLTMYDVALVLRDAGHRGMIHAISRRGLVPQPHRISDTPPPLLPFPESLFFSHPTPRKLLRALRQEIRSAAERGDNWREVITSLRHDTPRLWQSLGERGQRQFLRHLLPLWDTHRHRAAPQTAARVQQLRDQGQLNVRAARLMRIEHADGRGTLRVTLRPRGCDRVEQLEVAHIVNCTGPEQRVMHCGDELLADALARGTIVADALGLGIRASGDGALLRADGSTSSRLFTLGPLRRGELWETTAVPELRVQAHQLAERLLHF